MGRLIFITGIIFLIYSNPLLAIDQAFGLDEKPGSYIPDSIYVINECSVPVILNKLITKPTLMVPVYYHCPALCPKTLEGVAELINFTEAIPGKDYQIITISIDHKETTREAREAKQKYLKLVKKPVDPYFWRFFTADSITIRMLTDSIGWEFREVNSNFVHTTSTILLTPTGMVSQYFYGTYFNYMHFAMSVQKAAKEEIVPTRLKNLKYCYNYTPRKNSKVEIIITSFGIFVILLALVLFARLTFYRGRKTNHE